jgi:genome maintenance exonuclease 1
MQLCLDLFDYSSVKRLEESTGRKYVNNLGQKIPSVTTILSHTQDKTQLLAWRKRVGDQVADQISQESTSLGTLMHTHLENYLLGKDRPGGTNFGRKMAHQMADQIIHNGLKNVDQVWGIEVPLCYENLWAGTADLIGVHKGEPAIMDFKTTKKPKTRSRIDEYRLQLTAYRMCHDLSFNTNIRKLVVFMCSRDLQYQEFVYEFDNFDQDSTDWLWRVHDYYLPRKAGEL